MPLDYVKGPDDLGFRLATSRDRMDSAHNPNRHVVFETRDTDTLLGTERVVSQTYRGFDPKTQAPSESTFKYDRSGQLVGSSHTKIVKEGLLRRQVTTEWSMGGVERVVSDRVITW